MRIIAGSAKGRKLKTVPGMEVRPTTDRIKETLFNIIAGRIPDAAFLDLFAGSGQIGIEALSRGAGRAVFSDMSRSSIRCVCDNLKTCGLEQTAQVLHADAITVITRLEQQREKFDIIFLDPPYQQGLEREILLRLEQSAILFPDTLIIVEAALETDFSYLEQSRLIISRVKRYKTNQHVFITAAASENGQNKPVEGIPETGGMENRV